MDELWPGADVNRLLCSVTQLTTERGLDKSLKEEGFEFDDEWKLGLFAFNFVLCVFVMNMVDFFVVFSIFSKLKVGYCVTAFFVCERFVSIDFLFA